MKRIVRSPPIDYLSEAEKEIFRIVSVTVVPSRTQLRAALAIACNTLTMLQDDESFFSDIQKLRTQRHEHKVAFEEITGSVDHFLRHFLRAEKNLLVQVGLSPEIVEAITSFAAALREHTTRDMHPDKIRGLIHQLSEECCSAAAELDRKETDEHTRRRFQKRAVRAFYLIGGGVIVCADAGVAVVAFLTAAGAAVSGALGGAMMGAAFTLPES